MLTMSVLAVSIVMPEGVTIKPKNSIFLVWKALFGFGVQVVLTKMLQDTVDMNPMIFQ